MTMVARVDLSARSLKVLISEGIHRLRYPRGDTAADGWASVSVQDTISKGLVLGLMGWQIVLVAATVGTLGTSMTAGLITAGHVGCLALAWVTLQLSWNRMALVIAVYALFLVDWTYASSLDSVALFASWWAVVLVDTYVLDGRWWRVPLLLGLAGMPLVMVLSRPEWHTTLPLAAAAFIITTTPAARVGLSLMVTYTQGVDAETQRLERATSALEVRRTALHQAAEDGRVLHDTAINTMAAIANGGAGVDDIAAVRRRCHADVETLVALRTQALRDLPASEGLLDAIRPTGIDVHYSGLSPRAIRDLEILLPTKVTRAFSRATAEAVQNAAKHAGVTEVEVTIERTEDVATMTISDRGVGTERALLEGGGIEHSIFERAADAGITAAFASTAGVGTTVTLSYPLNSAPSSTRATVPNAISASELLHQVRARAAALVAAGLMVVATSMDLLNHVGRPSPEWLMLPLVAISSWLAWRSRLHTQLSRPTAIVLLVAGPIAFATSAWSADFGQTNPLLWQAVAPVAPTLALAILSTRSVLRYLAIAAYAATGIVIGVLVVPISISAANIMFIATGAGIALTVGVLAFARTATTVVDRAHREHREAFAIHVDTAAIEAADEARQRWRMAGLDQAIDLLDAIGEGRISPHDPGVQARCGEEEKFLRQLILLDPRLTQMGRWFAQAMSTARARGVELNVRAGSRDVAPAQAEALGATLLAAIEALPSGTMMTSSLLATKEGLVMTMVGPAPHLASLEKPAELALTNQTLGSHDLIEVTL